MPNRTYLCESCGRIRRAPKVYGRGEAARLAMPHCCERPTTMLSDIEAEGAAKLTPANRLIWAALGKRMLRRTLHGARKWQPALTERMSARGAAQHQEYEARLRRNVERRVRAWERKRAAARAKAKSGSTGRAV